MRLCDFQKWKELEEVVGEIEHQIKRLSSSLEEIKTFENSSFTNSVSFKENKNLELLNHISKLLGKHVDTPLGEGIVISLETPLLGTCINPKHCLITVWFNHLGLEQTIKQQFLWDAVTLLDKENS